ncbi:hypothetical protein dsx2_0489 [Desulfovibrio sp. X2]|uniref:hypothetical protein n=1 Tax=Desulfovibrio sp. X2 TaxID=941449 RepID=UPI000358D47C|nr:hypothetical protein [Desulfovibrio sp. X2]EPR38680.1 hypothetical protein dsx2_0489 [Desulfovibrio sp. X2]
MGTLTYFLFFVVTVLLLFMYLYGRFSQYNSTVSARQAELEVKEEKVRRRIETLDAEIKVKRDEIKVVSERLEGLRKAAGI